MDLFRTSQCRQFKNRATLLLTMVCYALSVGVGASDVVLQEGRYVALTWTGGMRVQIDLNGSKAKLVLPTVLKQSIDKRFPGFRIPRDQDYKLDWSESYDYPEKRTLLDPDYKVSEEKLKSSRVPFLVVGDLNQDGAKDVAALLVSEVDDTRWKLVVFHLTDGALYEPVILESSPEDCLGLPKGNCGPVQKYGLVIENRCTDGHPCLTSFVYESAAVEYLWRGGTYVRVHASD